MEERGSQQPTHLLTNFIFSSPRLLTDAHKKGNDQSTKRRRRRLSAAASCYLTLRGEVEELPTHGMATPSRAPPHQSVRGAGAQPGDGGGLRRRQSGAGGELSEVVNHMKDLIEFSHKNKLGPIEGLKNYPKQTGPKLPGQNMMHDTNTKGAKTEMSPHVNNEVPSVGAIGNNPQNQAAQNSYQHMMRSSSANQALLQQEASHNAVAANSYQNMLRTSSANQGLLQQEASQNAAALNNYHNMLRGSSANPSLLQQEASSIFKGPTAVHNGVQFRAGQLAQFQHPLFQQAMPQHQHNNFQGLGASPQFQPHVFHQLLQEAKNTNNRPMVQQQRPSTPNANGGLTPGAVITNSAASGEQTQHMNNGPTKGAAPVGTTGPSNLVINNSGAGMVQRSSSFKSVSSNPATTGGNATTPKAAESMHELDEDLDHLITHELAESGLFMGEQEGDGGYSWNL